MSESLWNVSIMEKRKEANLSIGVFAKILGISRKYLSNIENGSIPPSSELKELIDRRISDLCDDKPLQITIDYVRIRFNTKNVAYICNHILGIDFKHFWFEPYGFYSYTKHYRRGEIYLLTSDIENQGILLEMKGQGSRQFEGILKAQGRTWNDFFKMCLDEQAVFKRIDIAVDDMVGILDVKELAYKCEHGECISFFRNFKYIASNKINITGKKDEIKGNTLYLGSRASSIHICIYEKDYEQFLKTGQPVEDQLIKNRFEIRLRDDRAYYMIQELVNTSNQDKVVFSFINHYVRFVDKQKDIARNEWKLNERWKWFIGDYRDKINLTTKPKPMSYEKQLKWLKRQVAPTLKEMLIIDEAQQTTIIQDMIDDTNLKPNQIKMIHGVLTPVEDTLSEKYLSNKENDHE